MLFEVPSLLFYATTGIISWSNCDVRWKVDLIWQLAMTSSVAGLIRNSKALAKARLAPEKVMVTVWWSAACLIHYSFLNPGKTIRSEKYAQQIDEMHRKLQCLQPALVNRKVQLFSTTTPDCPSHNQCFKSWTNWTTKFCLICHIHLTSRQLTSTSSNILTTFCRENTSTTIRRQKMHSRSSSNSEAWIFILQE